MASARVVEAALLLACVLLGGCQSATRPVERISAPGVPADSGYVAGDVIVGFHDTVTEAQADAMFATHRLTWESSFPRDFSFWVEVESGELGPYLVRLSESPIVSWAKQRGNPNGRPGGVYILVMFGIQATLESAQALIDSLPGLSVSSMLRAPASGVANVEPGTERYWIEVLEREPIVKYAHPNWIIGYYGPY